MRVWREFCSLNKINPLKRLLLILFFIPVGLIAQKTDVQNLLVFQPDENSIYFDELYTSNFFFGNFDIRALVNAVPINNDKVKTIKISAETAGITTPNVMQLSYNSEGLLTQIQVASSLAGKEFTVDYQYSDGLLLKEIIKDKNGTKTNKFYFAEGKMIVETVQNMIDVYQLKGKVLYKTSYLKNKPVFVEKILGKCKTTFYMQKEIDKSCYSNFDAEFPLSIERYTTSKNSKTEQTILVPEATWVVQRNEDGSYGFKSGQTEIYKLYLDKDNRLQKFEFNGNKEEQKKPITFSFTTTYYN